MISVTHHVAAYWLARCDRCQLQTCAPAGSASLEAFVYGHACNGVQHVAMSVIEQLAAEILLERAYGKTQQ